ncbi:hypothetical protein DCAR_0625485 [Daucus carota subsp. sativus]|uniref:PHD-type domain-containing protein n=1 Tax=Daucus carota subsp. sativus TaxID=79200 RepID=A0AAF0XFE2_DAUCS|nr:hypothetical protein DCAR_0625485 [Daucus carota subsp. sativus]
MGQEELSAVYSGDNESYNNFRFKLRRCGLKWVPIMTVWEPCTKKRAKQGLKDIITEKDSSTEENLSNEHRQDAILGRSCSSQFVLENQSHASLTVVGKINYTCSKKREYNNQISAIPAGQSVGTSFVDEIINCVRIFFFLADNCLTNVEELLSTGILEGARVKYVSTSGNVKLLGIIKDGGYQCSCSICTMSKVLSAHEFELHAGGKSRNPHNHIYLDNGNSIYRIIEELWTTPLNMLEEVIKRVAGSSVNEEQLWTWKASLHQNKKLAKSYEDCNRKFLGMNNSSTGSSCSYRVHMFALYAMLPGLGLKYPTWIRVLVTNALHSLLFSPGGLQDGTILKYCVKEKVLRMGYKQEKGVICCCCGTKFSPSDFEKHAKHSRKRQPYNYIFTTNGHTLHNIAVDLLEGKSIESIVPSSSDDKCAVCRVAGGLVCDGCSRAHRPVCFRLEVPTRDWHCPNCTKNIGHGGRDPSPVNLHPHQVVMQPVYQPGDFNRFPIENLFLCDEIFGIAASRCLDSQTAHNFIGPICAKQYHVACCLADGSYEIIKSPKDIWFCCCDCKRIHLTMQSRLKGNKGLALNKKLIVDGAANSLHCQILSVKSSTTEDSRLLCKAATLFNVCFKKNISEWESRQIFCVVLIVDSMVASVGVLRIISGEIAELPVVATTKRYRGKGYFRALFSCIEHLLVSVNVKRIILPATKDAETMWTRKFGFEKLSVEKLSEYTRDYQFTMFWEASMLEKVLDAPNCESKLAQPTSQVADSSIALDMEE